MRRLLLCSLLCSLGLLSGCADSHVIGDFDAGPGRADASIDAPTFDVPIRFDAPPRADAGARDAGPIRFDSGPVIIDAGPVFDAGQDAAPPLDVVMECTVLCTRLDMCAGGVDIDECVHEGCTDIQELIMGPTCQSLAHELFRCADDVPCEGLQDTFIDGACNDVFRRFTAECGSL